MTHLFRLAERVINRPLMVLPDKLSLIASVLEGRFAIDASGLEPDASRFVGTREKGADGSRKAYRTDRGVAIIPIVGSLVNRFSYLDAASGLASYEKIKHLVSMAAADPQVSAILLDMDSPGGEAIGAFEAADVVRAAATKKPVTAVVNGTAGSAAYALASSASRIVTTSSGISGSIGVVLLHADVSRKLQMEGVQPTLIFAGARKVDGNPFQPLSEDVRTEIRAEVGRFYDLFVNSVAVNRSMTADKVRSTEARTFLGAEAVSAGLVDAVGSFESALSDLVEGRAAPRSLRVTAVPSVGGSASRLPGRPVPAPAAEAPTSSVDGLEAACARLVASRGDNRDRETRLPGAVLTPPAGDGLEGAVAALVRREFPGAVLTPPAADGLEGAVAALMRRECPGAVLTQPAGSGLEGAVDALVRREFPGVSAPKPMPMQGDKTSSASAVLAGVSRRS